MKKKLLLPLFGAVTIIAFSAFTVFYKTGMAKKSGSPADGGDCSTCHSGGAITPGISFTSTPSLGTGATYAPNTTYTITITGSGYSKYGIDFEILNSQSATASAVSDLGTLSTNGQSSLTLNAATTARPYSDIMHNVTNTSGVFKITWTSPASGTGYLYCALLGCNGDGTYNGDKFASFTLTLKAQSTVAVEKPIELPFFNRIWPNPGNGEYILDTEFKNYSIEIYNALGMLVQKESGLNNKTNININNNENGLYFVKIFTNDNRIYTTRIVKQ